MSGFETIAMIGAGLSAVSSIASGVIGAAGAQQQGNAARAQAEFEAKQLERRGQEEQAVATRRAAEETRKKEALLSRQTAVAAASGGGVTNPSILSLLEDTEAQGDYNARAQMFSGTQEREGLEMQAEGRRRTGRAAQRGARYRAAGTLISAFGNAGSSFARYG